MKIEKEIERVFRFMIPKEEHQNHIQEYLDDCRDMIKRIYELGIIEGRIRRKREEKKKFAQT